MQPDSHGVTIQACRHCGAGAPADAHFCPQCDKILSFVRHGDYFAFLGLPRKLNVDLKDLDRRLRSLSRQFHPDYYCNATPAERVASLERASYLNDAYRTLRDRASRIEYLLRIEGVPTKAQGGPDAAVSPELLHRVFEMNEELDAIREARVAGRARDEVRARLEAARHPIERHLAEHDRQVEELMARWDTLVDAGAPSAERRPVLDGLRKLLLEKNYVLNLLAAVDKESAAL